MPSPRSPTCDANLLVPPAPNRPLHNIVRALPMRCPYHVTTADASAEPARRRQSTHGADTSCASVTVRTRCVWQGPSETLQAHLSSECEYADRECPHEGCSERMDRLLIDEHCTTCPFRLVNCPVCEDEVPFHSLEEHERDFCPEKVVPCRYCQAPIKRRLHGTPPKWESGADADECQEGHYAICPKLPQHCPFRSLGCYGCYTRETMFQHFIDANEEHGRILGSHFEDLRAWNNWEMIRIVWEIDRDQLQPGSHGLLRLRSSTVRVAGEDVYVALELRGQNEPAQGFVCVQGPRSYITEVDSIYSFVQIDGGLSVDGASFETADDDIIRLEENLWDTPDKCYRRTFTCHYPGAPREDAGELAPGELPYHLIPKEVTRSDVMTGLRGDPPTIDIRTTFRVRKRNDVVLQVQ